MVNDVHWADFAATKLIKEKGDKKKYVCASGISPSGSVHIGNFREIITTDLVVKALEERGKKVRFIYSWDDYDRFRKVPLGIPDEWSKFIGLPYSDVPDPFKCHKSYAEHFEEELEDSIKNLGFEVEYIRQSKKYKSCDYANEIKRALVNKDKIIEILNRYRKEPLRKDWMPLIVYCEKCGKDSTNILEYDCAYEVGYECKCGYSNKIDFRKKGIVKLPWRVDWPMRWYYEQVDFEPGGKDHSVVGGSFDTGKRISKAVWDFEAPTYQMYDFISLKGVGGKISSSAGDVVTPKDVLEIYEPNLVRWLFVGSRPNAEFAISFDLDVLKLYEDFDKCERIYFGKEGVKGDKEELKQKKIYELSHIGKIPKSMPEQPSFRHLTNLLQIYKGDIDKVAEFFKNSERVKVRAKCALNWIQKYAPEDMKFSVHEKISKEVKSLLNDKQKEALMLVAKKLKQKKYGENELFEEFYKICEEVGIENKEFFKGAYLALIGKERGPKLANFILTIGKKRVIELFNEL